MSHFTVSYEQHVTLMCKSDTQDKEHKYKKDKRSIIQYIVDRCLLSHANLFGNVLVFVFLGDRNRYGSSGFPSLCSAKPVLVVVSYLLQKVNCKSLRKKNKSLTKLLSEGT